MNKIKLCLQHQENICNEGLQNKQKIKVKEAYVAFNLKSRNKKLVILLFGPPTSFKGIQSKLDVYFKFKFIIVLFKKSSWDQTAVGRYGASHYKDKLRRCYIISITDNVKTINFLDICKRGKRFKELRRKN